MSIRDGVVKIPAPRYLQKCRDEIRHIFDHVGNSNDKWHYNASDWKEIFLNDPEISDDLDVIMKECPKKITRVHVQYFAHKIRSGSYPDIRRLFLACMIWGYGLDANGPRNTKASLSAPTEARRVLINTLSRIKKIQIKEAYDEFVLAGCGPAFFTKFFYFIGKEYGIEPMPLILDSHVANFLEFLSKQEGWKQSLFTKRSQKGYVKRYTQGYIQYICSMDGWAKTLGCSADKIEYFMYKKDQELPQEEKEEGIPENGILWRRDGLHCFYCEELLASPPFDKVNIKNLIREHVCRINRAI